MITNNVAKAQKEESTVLENRVVLKNETFWSFSNSLHRQLFALMLECGGGK